MFPRDVEGVLSWSCHVAWVPSLSLARVCPQHSCCPGFWHLCGQGEPRAGGHGGPARAGEQQVASSWAAGASRGLSHLPQAGPGDRGSRSISARKVWILWFSQAEDLGMDAGVSLCSQGQILRCSLRSAEPQLPSGLCLSFLFSAVCLLPCFLLKIAWCQMLCPPTAAQPRGHLQPVGRDQAGPWRVTPCAAAAGPRGGLFAPSQSHQEHFPPGPRHPDAARCCGRSQLNSHSWQHPQP